MLINRSCTDIPVLCIEHTTWGAEKSPDRIVCAANLYSDGTMLIGPRHGDAVMVAQLERNPYLTTLEPPKQGFITQYGEFKNRRESYLIAKEQGQIVRRCGGDEGRLFSENLY